MIEYNLFHAKLCCYNHYNVIIRNRTEVRDVVGRIFGEVVGHNESCSGNSYK